MELNLRGGKPPFPTCETAIMTFPLLNALQLTLNLRVRIPECCQISRSRLRVQFTQQGVVPLLGFQLRNPAVGIVYVTKNDRLRRTDSLTSGHDLPVAYLSSFKLRLDLGALYALHAVSAFLHHAAAAHRHFR